MKNSIFHFLFPFITSRNCDCLILGAGDSDSNAVGEAYETCEIQEEDWEVKDAGNVK